MKAFLLAAGKGTRLRPLTLKTAKCLVPISGHPLLEIWCRKFEDVGITDVLINTHYLSDQVVKYLSTLKTSVNFHVSYEKELLGSAGTIRRNRDFVSNESDFLIIYADNLTTFQLSEIIAFHKNKAPVLTMGLFHAENPSECGIVSLDKNNLITKFVEKPMHPETDLSNAGVMAASTRIFKDIPDKCPCDLSYDVLPKLVGRMYGYVIEDFFIDIGTMEKYKKAQDAW